MDLYGRSPPDDSRVCVTSQTWYAFLPRLLSTLEIETRVGGLDIDEEDEVAAPACAGNGGGLEDYYV